MGKIKLKYYIFTLIIFAVVLTAFFKWPIKTPVSFNTNAGNPAENSNTSTVAAPTQAKEIFQPLSDALSRVTKKPFGIKISPSSSPVSPERFTGYHTGADFEATPAEQNTDVAVNAICSGPMVRKEYGRGYGGMVVQRCTINNSDVTVVYGHLRLTSISAVIDQSLSAGQQFALLGTGYSTETDGERKHLHLGIHKGTIIDTRGYVQDPQVLNNWIDPLALLK